MSSGDNIGGGTTKPSSSRRLDPEISRNQRSLASLYTRVENAKGEANSILQETSNWPRNSVTAIKELLETINDAPDLRDIPSEPNSMPDGLRVAIEQYVSAMKDVVGRLKKTYSKYGSNRKFSDVVKYPFAPLSKDGCAAALRGCGNDINKALAAVREHLEDNPVTQHPLTGQANEGLGGSASNQNQSTDADAETTPGNTILTPQQSPSTAETPSVDHTESEQATAQRRGRLTAARTTFETIEGISGAIPVVGSYIGAGCKVGLAVVKMIQTMDSNTNTAKELESRTERLSNLLGHFNERSTERAQGELLQQITKLKSELQSVLNKLDELDSQGTLRKGFTSSGQAEALKGYQETIRVALEELQLLVGLNTTNLLNELYDTEKRKEQRRLLDRLGDAGYGARGNAIEEVICLPGTRVEVLGRIDGWIRNTPPSDRVLWIRGMAGRGKSTIASTVAHNWRYRASVAIFHFRRGQRTLAQRLVCSLARQLGSSVISEVKEEILQSIRENEDVAQERLQEQFKLLLVASAKRLQNPIHPTLIVVDAVDECEDSKYAVDFINLLHRHAASFPPSFKFLITTRPETPLLEALEQGRWPTENLDVLTSIDQDIAELLRRRFSVIREKRGLGDDWPTQADIRSLVKMSQGLFQWAQTAMEYISGGLPKRRLEELLRSPPLFDGLDNLYTQILSNAYERAKKLPGRAELLLRLLGMLAVAAYPVSPEIFTYISAEQIMFRDIHQQEMIELLRLEILCDLGSLVYIPDLSNQPMRLVHTSIRDLLVDEQRCGGKPYFIDLGQNHRNLTSQCLDLMIRNLRENMCHLSDLSKSNAEVQDVVERKVSKGLEYCCRSWFAHLMAGDWTSKATDASFEIALSDLKTFSKRQLLYWLEVMSLVGATIDAMAVAKQVYAWLQAKPNAMSDSESELMTIWSDAHRFVASFLEPISFGALHIYASALPFCPTKTKVWEYYGSHALNSILHGPQELLWPPSLWERSVGSGVNVVVFLQDGKVLASGCQDHTIRFWDSETGMQLGEPLMGHNSRVEALASASDGKTLASGSNDGVIRLWDAESGDMLGQRFEGHTDRILCLTFSSNDKALTSVSSDRTIRFWDCETGLSLGLPVTFCFPESERFEVVLSPDAKVLASTAEPADKAIQLWDAKAGTPLDEPLIGHYYCVQSLAFSPDGKILASGDRLGTLILWDVTARARIHYVPTGDESWILALAFSPDGDILASASSFRTASIEFWDVRTGTGCGRYPGDRSSPVKTLAFSPNGRILASGLSDETVKLWDVQGAPAETNLSRPIESWVYAVACSPDGKVIASGGSANTVQLWDAETGTPSNTLPACHSDIIIDLAFSPDGMVLASGSHDKTVCLWDTRTWALLGAPLSGHTASVNVLAFSPDGKILASGSRDNTILLWDTTSRAPLNAPQTYHALTSSSLAFSPDGRVLASGWSDGIIRLLDAATGALTGSMGSDSWREVVSLEFVLEGKLIAKSGDNAVVLYDTLTSQRCDPDASLEYRAYNPFQEPFRSLTFNGPWISFFSQRLLWVPLQHWTRKANKISICQGKIAFISAHYELFILDVSRSLSL